MWNISQCWTSLYTVKHICTVVMYVTLSNSQYDLTLRKMCRGVLQHKPPTLSLKSPPVGNRVQVQMPPQCGSGRITAGAWVNTDQSSQHKYHTGLCKAAMGHLATSQCSVSALCATTSIILRIEAAGVSSMACCRNDDCGQRNSKAWSVASREKQCVCVARTKKKSKREMRKS